jgi:hypothetical protein
MAPLEIYPPAWFGARTPSILGKEKHGAGNLLARPIIRQSLLFSNIIVD